MRSVATGCPIACWEIWEKEGSERNWKILDTLMKEILGDVPIKGFRAPTFSLNQNTKWALPILRDFGYLYDSSIFPKKLFWNPLYGLDDAPRHPYRISFEDLRREDPKSPLWEFPAAIARVAGIRSSCERRFLSSNPSCSGLSMGLEADEQERAILCLSPSLGM